MSRFRDEIGEQPECAGRLLRSAAEPVAAVAARLRSDPPVGFLVAARGSSDHAALYGQYLLGSRNRALVALATPSLFTRYNRPPRLEGWCVVGISQSGASPDVVAVLAEARRQGCPTVAITNRVDSALSEAAELVIDLDAGPERSVPASKTYVASLLALAMISQALDPDPAFAAALAKVPAALARALESDGDLARLVPTLLGPRAVVLGRGFNLATAEEVALKLTETSYVLARAWSVADFEHGPIAVLEPGFRRRRRRRPGRDQRAPGRARGTRHRPLRGRRRAAAGRGPAGDRLRAAGRAHPADARGPRPAPGPPGGPGPQGGP